MLNLCIQNFGSRYLNPRSGPREHPVTNLKNITKISAICHASSMNMPR